MLQADHTTRKWHPLDPRDAGMGAPRQGALSLAAFLLVCVVGLAVPNAQAQQPAASIVGHVVDRQTRAPVQGAHVRLTWTEKSAIADSAGRFELAGLVPGMGLLQVRAIGFRIGSWSVTLASGSVVADTFELDAVPIELSELVVPAKPSEDWRSPEGFERRRHRGGGYFVTEEMIRQQRPTALVEVLRTVPGIDTNCNIRGCVVRMVRSTRGCSPEYFLDGFPATFATGPEFPIQAIRGIEVYPDEFSVPIEFQRIGLRCGLIAIWTRMER